MRKRLPDTVADLVRRGAEGVHQLATDPKTLAISGAWAATNWLLDVAVVLPLALTIGQGTPLAPILLAYIIAQLAAAVPLTPGGRRHRGDRDDRRARGRRRPAAGTTTVLGWRLITDGLPILAGLALLPTITRHRAPDRPDPVGGASPGEGVRRGCG